jgi:hypothetical protein
MLPSTLCHEIWRYLLLDDFAKLFPMKKERKKRVLQAWLYQTKLRTDYSPVRKTIAECLWGCARAGEVFSLPQNGVPISTMLISALRNDSLMVQNNPRRRIAETLLTNMLKEKNLVENMNFYLCAALIRANAVTMLQRFLAEASSFDYGDFLIHLVNLPVVSEACCKVILPACEKQPVHATGGIAVFEYLKVYAYLHEYKCSDFAALADCEIGLRLNNVNRCISTMTLKPGLLAIDDEEIIRTCILANRSCPTTLDLTNFEGDILENFSDIWLTVLAKQLSTGGLAKRTMVIQAFNYNYQPSLVEMCRRAKVIASLLYTIYEPSAARANLLQILQIFLAPDSVNDIALQHHVTTNPVACLLAGGRFAQELKKRGRLTRTAKMFEEHYYHELIMLPSIAREAELSFEDIRVNQPVRTGIAAEIYTILFDALAYTGRLLELSLEDC